MTNELKQEFTRRITKANKTELIVILYDMLLQYILDSKLAVELDNENQFKIEIRRARQCIDELIASLDLQYAIGVNLFQIYQFMKREFILAKFENPDILDHMEKITKELLFAYNEISRQDYSLPVMEHTETVYAGITYGKKSINENADYNAKTRGYLI